MGLAVAGGEVALGHPEGVPGLPLRERTRLTCSTWRRLEGWLQFQLDEGVPEPGLEGSEKVPADVGESWKKP